MKRINRCQPFLCQTAKRTVFQIPGSGCSVCVWRGGVRWAVGGRGGARPSGRSPTFLAMTGECTSYPHLRLEGLCIHIKKKVVRQEKERAERERGWRGGGGGGGGGGRGYSGLGPVMHDVGQEAASVPAAPCLAWHSIKQPVLGPVRSSSRRGSRRRRDAAGVPGTGGRGAGGQTRDPARHSWAQWADTFSFL